MKAPDIYTELVITNFLENKKKRKKKAGKATSTGQHFQGSHTKKHVRGRSYVQPASSCLLPQSFEGISHMKQSNVQFMQQPKKKKSNKAPCLVKTMVCWCGKRGRKQIVTTKHTTDVTAL